MSWFEIELSANTTDRLRKTSPIEIDGVSYKLCRRTLKELPVTDFPMNVYANNDDQIKYYDVCKEAYHLERKGEHANESVIERDLRNLIFTSQVRMRHEVWYNKDVIDTLNSLNIYQYVAGTPTTWTTWYKQNIESYAEFDLTLSQKYLYSFDHHFLSINMCESLEDYLSAMVFLNLLILHPRTNVMSGNPLLPLNHFGSFFGQVTLEDDKLHLYKEEGAYTYTATIKIEWYDDVYFKFVPLRGRRTLIQIGEEIIWHPDLFDAMTVHYKFE